MKYSRYFAICAVIFLLSSVASAQRPEVTIGLNEAFFDSLLDAVFQNSSPIEFSIASNNLIRRDAETQREDIPTGRLAAGESRFTSLNHLLESEASTISAPTFAFSASPHFGNEKAACKEVIQLLRESNGVRTAVRFREGKILAPLAFTGDYNPPFVGCVPFSGYAETVIDLEFDQPNQRLIARARVMNVNLNGTGGVGGTLIAKMVQGSIDKKINPMEIVRLDKLSYALPVRGSAVNMKAVGIRSGVEAGLLNIHIAYEFVK